MIQFLFAGMKMKSDVSVTDFLIILRKIRLLNALIVKHTNIRLE